MRRCVNQSAAFQQLQMLHYSRARDRQAARKLAGGLRCAREALKDDHPDGVTEQREQTHDPSQLGRVCVGFCHIDVLAKANTFDSAT
jgi:hypothetical protein